MNLRAHQTDNRDWLAQQDGVLSRHRSNTSFNISQHMSKTKQRSNSLIDWTSLEPMPELDALTPVTSRQCPMLLIGLLIS
jgi:hypothetical protein